jgi:DNA helicase HerA-like ATPase
LHFNRRLRAFARGLPIECKNDPIGIAPSESDWDAARRREEVVRPLVARGSATQSDLEAAAIELGLSRSFLYKLLARYKRRPQTSSFLFAKRGRPEDSRSLDPEREQLIQTAIQEFLPSPRTSTNGGLDQRASPTLQPAEPQC